MWSLFSQIKSVFDFETLPSLQKNSQEQINHILCLGFGSTMPFSVAISSFNLCSFFLPSSLCSFLIFLMTSWGDFWATCSLSYGSELPCHSLGHPLFYGLHEIHFKEPLTEAQLVYSKYSQLFLHIIVIDTLIIFIKPLKFFFKRCSSDHWEDF